MAQPSDGYGRSLVRLAALVIRDQAEAEQVVRDVLASSPPHSRGGAAERRAVLKRCEVIIRERVGLPPD